jgi:hypothetical protein
MQTTFRSKERCPFLSITPPKALRRGATVKCTVTDIFGHQHLSLDEIKTNKEWV